MTIIDWVFVCAVLGAVFTAGALTSSWLNRRLIWRMMEKLDHNTANVKMNKQAMEHLIQKVIDTQANEKVALQVAAAKPTEVTIVNNLSEPVPVEDVNGKE